MLDTCLWTHTTKRVSLVFHVDDLLLAGTHQINAKILDQLSRDLELKSSEVTTKPTRYMGRTLVKTQEVYNPGVYASYVESMLEEFNMSALNSSPTLRWERCETDEKAMLASKQRVYRQLVGQLLWIDRADLRCAMGKASSSLGRASDPGMRNIKLILRYLSGNPGIMTVRPTLFNLEAVKRALVGSVLTYGDSDRAGDADRFSVSGTASCARQTWLVPDHRVEQETVDDRTQQW